MTAETTPATAPLGPSLAVMSRRLADCPVDFLAEPLIGGLGYLHVDALISDVVVDCGGAELLPEQTRPFQAANPQSRKHLQLVAVCCWLLADEGFRNHIDVPSLLGFLSTEVASLAAMVPAGDFITNGERREELARRCLRALGMVPLGESETQAADRLANLDTEERQRVLAASRAAEERSRAVRRAMVSQRAAEAAARYTPT